MFLVGYTENVNQLRDPNARKIVTARNVIFDESKMMGERTEV